jgi:2-oxoisovalerate dehydrogenase E1 component
MFGGDHDMPLLMRIKIGTGTGYGSQHSMDPAGIMATSVGWRIIAPSSPMDYVGLINAAMHLKDPVVVLEHDADLYKITGPAPKKDWNYILPPGQAAVRREGKDVTVLTYLSMVTKSLQAAEKSGVDAEVIDLRWLDRASLDWDAIERSIKKTNKVLIVEQGSLGTSYGGWLADELQNRFFDWLDAPVGRVTGSESSPSISKVLEAAALAGVDDIVDALKNI